MAPPKRDRLSKTPGVSNALDAGARQSLPLSTLAARRALSIKTRPPRVPGRSTASALTTWSPAPLVLACLFYNSCRASAPSTMCTARGHNARGGAVGGRRSRPWRPRLRWAPLGPLRRPTIAARDKRVRARDGGDEALHPEPLAPPLRAVALAFLFSGASGRVEDLVAVAEVRPKLLLGYEQPLAFVRHQDLVVRLEEVRGGLRR